MQTWINVFLFIIAFQALVQGALVVALALAARRGGRAIASLEVSLDHELKGRMETAVQVTERAASVAEATRAQAERASAVLEEAGLRVRGVLDRASSVVSRASEADEDADEDVDGDADEDDLDEDADEGRGRVLPGRLGQGLALLKGARRAWQVWNETREPS